MTALAKPSIITPGQYPGLAAEFYHNGPGWRDRASASKLKVLYAKSPAHCQWIKDHPTQSDVLFSAIHTAILEPELYLSAYTVAGQCEKITGKGERCLSAGKNRIEGHWYCNTKSHTPDGLLDDVGEVLSLDDDSAATDAAAAVLQHGLAGKMIRSCDPDGRELSLAWVDDKTGVKCKCRLDGLTRSLLVLDIKNTGNARVFLPQARKQGYGIQAAFYMRGCRAVGIPVLDFFFVAVESKPPHGVAVYQVTEECLARWDAVIDELLELWAACEEGNNWPSHSDGRRLLDIPVYEDDLEF